jgi:hypothetical protein
MNLVTGSERVHRVSGRWIGIRGWREYRSLLLDVRDLLLLLVIGLHLVDLVLTLRLDERRVVTSIIDELNTVHISLRFMPGSLIRTFFLGVSSIIFVQMVSIKS